MQSKTTMTRREHENRRGNELSPTNAKALTSGGSEGLIALKTNFISSGERRVDGSPSKNPNRLPRQTRPRTISLMHDLSRSRSSLVRPAWFTSLLASVTNRLGGEQEDEAETSERHRMRHVANLYCGWPLDVLCTLQTSALASLPVHVFLTPTHTILTNDHYLCSLPAADAELLQHSPDSALREGLLCFKDLLHVIQTLFLLGQKHNFVLNCLLSQIT